MSKTLYFSVIVFVFLSLCFVNLNGNAQAQIKNENVDNLSIVQSKSGDISSKYNKLIIVGDSRMEYMASDDEVNIPNNISVIAKAGAGYDWYFEDGLKDLENIISHDNEKIQYSVVINMGVNDLNSVYTGKTIAQRYYSSYEMLSKTYPYVNFYILSINPINDNSYIKKPFPKVTNKKIEEANSYFKNKSKDKINIEYCDSYNSVKFDIYDGIHYTSETSQDVLDFIVNKCVNYN